MDAKILESLSSLGSALIGGSLALLGGYFALRNERKKAKEEREFNSKQKVLESAIESATRFLDYFQLFPDKKLPLDGEMPIELRDMSVNINRLQLYCAISTLKEIINSGVLMLDAMSKAIKPKLEAIFYEADININNIEIDRLQKENEKIYQEIVATLSANPNSSFLELLYKHRAEKFEELSKRHGKNNDLIKLKYEATEACREIVITILSDVHIAVCSFILAARKELKFGIDEAEYIEIFKQSFISSSKKVQEHQKEIRKITLKKME